MEENEQVVIIANRLLDLKKLCQQTITFDEDF